jgi:hypothetical protein
MLGNGISGLRANGFTAQMNTDNGQQWVVPTAALKMNRTAVSKQLLTVEVIDVDRASYGTFLVPLDPLQIEDDCGAGNWASNAIASRAFH